MGDVDHPQHDFIKRHAQREAPLDALLDFRIGDGLHEMCIRDRYTNAIEYTYNVAPQIYSSNTDKLRQVNPDKSLSALGLGLSLIHI